MLFCDFLMAVWEERRTFVAGYERLIIDFVWQRMIGETKYEQTSRRS